MIFQAMKCDHCMSNLFARSICRFFNFIKSGVASIKDCPCSKCLLKGGCNKPCDSYIQFGREILKNSRNNSNIQNVYVSILKIELDKFESDERKRKNVA